MAENEIKQRHSLNKTIEKNVKHSKQLVKIEDCREKSEALVKLQKRIIQPVQSPANYPIERCSIYSNVDEEEQEFERITERADLIDRLISEIIPEMEESKNIIDVNTAKWIKKSPCEVIVNVVNLTADSYKRASTTTPPKKVALFPDREKNPKHFQSDERLEGYDNQNVFFKDSGMQAWQNSNNIFLIACHMKDNKKVKTTLVHELQHFADKNSGTEFQKQKQDATKSTTKLNTHTKKKWFSNDTTTIYNTTTTTQNSTEPYLHNINIRSYIFIEILKKGSTNYEKKVYCIEKEFNKLRAVGYKVEVHYDKDKSKANIKIRYVGKNAENTFVQLTDELTLSDAKKMPDTSTPFYSFSFAQGANVSAKDINDENLSTEESTPTKSRAPLCSKSKPWDIPNDTTINEQDILEAYRSFKTEFAAHFISEVTPSERSEENIEETFNKIIKYPNINLIYTINPPFMEKKFRGALKKYIKDIKDKLKTDKILYIGFNDLNSERINRLYSLIDLLDTTANNNITTDEIKQIEMVIEELNEEETNFVLYSPQWRDKTDRVFLKVWQIQQSAPQVDTPSPPINEIFLSETTD